MSVPAPLVRWFDTRGWSLHPHQQAMLDLAYEPATLLIAPTGGGKTLAGFLPTLADLAAGDHAGLHTLYVSPLKALAADIRRNLTGPVTEMGLPIRVEDRTGDTSSHVKRRQRADPPHILLTTPESLALMTSYEDAPRLFAGLKARGRRRDPRPRREQARRSAHACAGPAAGALPRDAPRGSLGHGRGSARAGAVSRGARHALRGAQRRSWPEPDIAMLETAAPPPWAGGGAAHAIPEVLAQVRRHRTTLIFHNTRAQAEIFFHNLWLANDDALPIGIHHGSLDRVQRERVEAAMVAGQLRAIVCTGSLDLGLDWGDVDLVIQIGAPKNVKRLVQRIGRANHRYNAPSKALLVPANRFEVVECHAALQAARARDLDGDPRGAGPRDVLCQHILIRACAGPFDAGDLFDEMRGAGPYAALTRAEFDACLDFCATGGYALRAYDRWQRLKQRPDGLWQLRDPRAARGIRMNIGTIQDTDTLKVRMKRQRGGKPLGEIEEGFAATLSPGDTFLMGGQIVRFESLREMVVEVSRDPGREPKIATYMGTKFATSTQLSERILTILGQDDWPDLPGPIRDWLHLQRKVSQMPQAGRLLIESFPHGGRAHTCIYGFAGRNAMQTLGLLVTKRMEEEGLAPMGFVATDYATLIWGLEPVREAAPLFAPETLRKGLDQWLMSNAVMKRTFRASATIAGLIQRNSPQARKSGRQATLSSDIIYDTLVKYDPGHLLLEITRDEAMRGLVDFGRIEEMLARTCGRIAHRHLPRVSPLAAPLFLEAGRVPVAGAAQERLLAEEATRLMAEAGLPP